VIAFAASSRELRESAPALSAHLPPNAGRRPRPSSTSRSVSAALGRHQSVCLDVAATTCLRTVTTSRSPTPLPIAPHLGLSGRRPGEPDNYFIQYGSTVRLRACRVGILRRWARARRKLPIIAAGVLLGDAAMKGLRAVSRPVRRRHADGGREPDPGRLHQAWQGAAVIYGGHLGVRADGTPVDTTPFNNGPGLRAAANPEIGRCGAVSRSVSLTAAAAPPPASSAKRSLRACSARSGPRLELPRHVRLRDRWMTEDDTQAVADINTQSGFDYSADWAPQGQTAISCRAESRRAPFIDDLWNAYRASH